MTEPRLPAGPTAIGRLRKRIEKLTKQRDYFRERCGVYGEMINMHPMLEHRFKAWKEQRAEAERVKGLEQRIKEQAQLIELLQKGKQ